MTAPCCRTPQGTWDLDEKGINLRSPNMKFCPSVQPTSEILFLGSFHSIIPWFFLPGVAPLVLKGLGLSWVSLDLLHIFFTTAILKFLKLLGYDPIPQSLSPGLGWWPPHTPHKERLEMFTREISVLQTQLFFPRLSGSNPWEFVWLRTQWTPWKTLWFAQLLVFKTSVLRSSYTSRYETCLHLWV